jgi:hypothetical protein
MITWGKCLQQHRLNGRTKSTNIYEYYFTLQSWSLGMPMGRIGDGHDRGKSFPLQCLRQKAIRIRTRKSPSLAIGGPWRRRRRGKSRGEEWWFPPWVVRSPHFSPTSPLRKFASFLPCRVSGPNFPAAAKCAIPLFRSLFWLFHRRVLGLLRLLLLLLLMMLAYSKLVGSIFLHSFLVFPLHWPWKLFKFSFHL